MPDEMIPDAALQPSAKSGTTNEKDTTDWEKEKARLEAGKLEIEYVGYKEGIELARGQETQIGC
jgi:hypothetical protein